MTLDRGLVGAVGEWRRLLGPENVITDSTLLDDRRRATFAHECSLLACLLPRTVSAVSQLVRIAHDHGVPLYPISTGRNWGYGSMAPPRAGCVLLDLRHLNQVREFDERCQFITVEPGVTFRDVDRLLREKGSALALGMHGGPRDSSVIGNALERGMDDSGSLQRSETIVSLEAVLPCGDVVRTGYARHGDGTMGTKAPFGLGPDLTQLFVQSSLGVVTAMTFSLRRRSRYEQKCVFELDTADGLAEVVEVLRELRADGWLSRPVKILTRSRVLDLVQARDAADSCPASSGTTSVRLPVGYWMGSFGLPAQTPAHASILREAVTAALARCVERIAFIGETSSSSSMAALRRERGWFAAMSDDRQPEDVGLRMLYRKKDGAPSRPLNPDGDGCGLIWVNAVAPAAGHDLSRAHSIVESACTARGFDVDIAITIPSVAYAVVLVALVFDRDREGADESAIRCREALNEALAAVGFPPYRLDVGAMSSFNWPDDGHAQAWRAMKAAVDPRGIMSPGRYS